MVDAFLLNDRALRRRWTGEPVEDVRVGVEASLRASGVRLPDPALDGYAAAIAAGSDFGLTLDFWS